MQCCECGRLYGCVRYRIQLEDFDPNIIGVVVIPMYRPGLGPGAYSLVRARRGKG
jgi:hypothetical protein